MTAQQLRHSQQRAIVKAQSAKLVRLVEPVDASTYFVPSTTRPRVWYLVSRSRFGAWTCTCRAGKLGWPCVHSAAAWKFSVNESAAGGAIPSAPADPLPGVARIGWTETPLDAVEFAAIYGRRGAA